MAGVPSLASESRTAATTTRVRRMRAARGACWVIAAGLGAAAGFAALDAAVRLPGWVRGLGLAVWVTAVGVLAWRLVVVPWRERPAPRNPDAQARRELNGNLNAAAAAAVALAGCLLAATLVPGAADHFRRVAVPWHRPPVGPHRVVVTSGEPVLRRGSSVALTAFVEGGGSTNTPAATFVFRDRPGEPETRVEATADANAAFHVIRPAVPGDFEYRVEVAGSTSDWFAVAVLDPAEVAPESVTEINPPKYAPAVGRTVLPGFAPVNGFRHGTVEFRLRFTRPAAAAFLDFRPDTTGPAEHAQIALAPDRLSGTGGFRLRQDGTVRLVTVADRAGKKLREEVSVPVRVVPDRPPHFERVTGVAPRAVRVPPNGRLPVGFVAADDLGLGGAVLEYIPAGETKPVAVPVPLTAAGSGRLDFDLDGKGFTGETVRVRLRVWDSRKLDDPDLKPQEVTYPVGGWAAVTLDPAAPPLDQQEIVARRDATRDALQAALAEARALAADAEAVAMLTAGKASLDPDHVVRLTALRERLGKVAGALAGAAREAALVPDLRPLAAGIREAAGELREEAGDALTGATSDDPGRRAAALAAAGRAFTAAADHAEALAARNERLGRDRLDRKLIAALAADQAALAGHPDPDPLRRQQELLARLRQLLADSEPLRAAADAAKLKDIHRLAGEASDLAGMILALDAAARQLQADIRAGVIGSIAADQTRLATKAADLFAKAATPARLANVVLPRPAEFATVTDLIAAGKTVAALTELERLGRVLDAAAAAVERLAAGRADPKAAARQLAAWQADLRARFRAATANTAATFRSLPDATKAGFRTEQAAVRAAVADLRLPPGELKTTHETVADHLARTAEFLAASGANADQGMKAAADQLDRLADLCPTVPERLARTRGEFETLRQEQESIRTAAEQHTRGADPAAAAALARKLGPALKRQTDQIAAFAALDLPGHEVRKARVALALAAAAADLRDGLPFDAAASQAWVRREFDRLRTALTDANPPPDDRADDLARRLASVAAAVEALGPDATAKQLEPLVVAQQELVKQANAIPPLPEAPALRHDAVEAVELAFRATKTEKPEELVRRLRGAAGATGKLADRLGGGEPDAARVRRLASARKAAAEDKKPAVTGADAARQLAREADELLFTRVGPAGQLLKKRALDQYAKLKDHPTPERQTGAQKQLADTLDELAARAADIPGLAAGFDRFPPTAAPEADAFWPSKALADALRDLATRQRALRDRISGVGPAVRVRSKPGAANPLAGLVKRQRELATAAAALAEMFGDEFAAAERATTAAADRLRLGLVSAAKESAEEAVKALRGRAKSAGLLAVRQVALAGELADVPDVAAASAAQQKARAGELVGLTDELVRVYELAARDLGPDEPAGKALTDAAATVKAAGKLLAEATEKADRGQAGPAEKLRNEAQAQLQVAAARVAGAAPESTTLPEFDSAVLAAGLALNEAEAAMRRAVAELGSQPAAAGTAIRAAAAALERAR